MDAAFDRLRRYARNHHLRLSDVAREVVLTDLAADVLTDTPTHPERTNKARA
jgi:ANTAR domain